MYRTNYYWDPACGRYVAYQESYWVPEAYSGRVYHRGSYYPYPPHHHQHHYLPHQHHR